MDCVFNQCPQTSKCPPPCELNASATITIQEPKGRVVIPISKRVTGTKGYLKAGCISCSFLNDGGDDAILNGAIFKAGTSLSWPALGGNDTYGAITYDATNTTIRFDWTAHGAGAPITPDALVEE